VAYTRRNKEREKCDRNGTTRGRPFVIADATLDQMLQKPQKQRRKRVMKQARDLGITTSEGTVEGLLIARKRARIFKSSRQNEVTDDQEARRRLYATRHRFEPIHGFWVVIPRRLDIEGIRPSTRPGKHRKSALGSC
jgi:hypothetical protein